MANKVGPEDLWDDDFDEADVEESIFKASQVCNLPDAAGPSKQSTSAIEIEHQEIQKLLQDPSLLSDDPNIFLPDEFQPHIQEQVQPKQPTVQEDDNFYKFFDSFDHIDPDLLSSQPIPGTQPRQRWQRCGSGNNITSNKNPVVTVNQGASSSSRALSVGNNTSSKSVISQNTTANQISYQSPATCMKPPNPTLAASSIPHVQVNHPKPGLSPSIGARKLQQSGAYQPQKTIPGPSHDQRTSYQILADAPAANVNDIQSVQKKALLQEQELKKKLLQSQQHQSDLEREIMTKKGEVSCLRNELQRKVLALDTERLARLSAVDVHKKELQDKVAAATREAQSKSRALEKRLEKLHSDMAFKNREIIELITKCKKMEQLQMHQQKRYQDQLSQQEHMLSQQIASSQEKERQHQSQLLTQSSLGEDGKMSPPLPPFKTPTTASKPDAAGVLHPASTSRKFPADRFDFSDSEPAAAKQQCSRQASATVSAAASVQQQLESLQQEFTDKHQAQQNEDVPEDMVVIEGIVLDSQKGFYKASLECIALLDRLSNGELLQNPTASEAARVAVSVSARERLVEETISRKTEHHQLVDLDEEGSFTSVIKPRTRDNADVILDEDREELYRDNYDSWERETAENESLRTAGKAGVAGKRVKKEPTVKNESETQNVVNSDDGSCMEVDDNGTEYDEVTGARVGFVNFFKSAYNRKVKMQSKPSTGGHERSVWDWEFNWSDDMVAHQVSKMAQSDQDGQVFLYRDTGKRSSDQCWLTKEPTTSVKHVEVLPQEWVTLLSFMANDDNLHRHEKPEDEDMLSDEELDSDLCGQDFAAGDGLEEDVTPQRRKEDDGANDPRLDHDAHLKKRPDPTKKRREQLALAPHLGQFLYDLTQEMLEENIRDLNYSNNHRIEDDEEGACAGTREVGGNKAQGKSQKGKKECKTKCGSGFSKHSSDAIAAQEDIDSDFDGDDDNLLAGIQLHFGEENTGAGEHHQSSDADHCGATDATRRRRGDQKRTSSARATRRLFFSVLEWLAQEATYFRNVEKGLVGPRSEEKNKAQLSIMKTALTILEHLLPLRFGCGHLPAPMIVLGYILYPKEMAPQVACAVSPSILSCMQVCARHPSTLMTPEMALLLVDRLCRVCRYLSCASELNALLQCLETLGQHRIFMQTVCGMAEECLVGQVCVNLLDLCSEPYTENTVIKRSASGSPTSKNPLFSHRSRPVVVTPPRSGVRTPVTVESDTDRCLRSFLRWVVGVLMARPAWLLGECQCCLVLLATLLIVTHTEVYQLVKALPMINTIKENCCTMHQSSMEGKTAAGKAEAIEDDAAGPRASRRVVLRRRQDSASATEGGETNSTSDTPFISNQTSLVNKSNRNSSIMISTSLCCSKDSSEAIPNPASTAKNITTLQRASHVLSASKAPASDPTNNETLPAAVARQMTCSVCNTETLCSHTCSCSGQCAEYYDQSLFDIHSKLGCRCKYVWAAVRVLKLFLSVDQRSTMHTASVPHYTLLVKLLAEALPFFAPLSDPDTSKLVSRLH